MIWEPCEDDKAYLSRVFKSRLQINAENVYYVNIAGQNMHNFPSEIPAGYVRRNYFGDLFLATYL